MYSYAIRLSVVCTRTSSVCRMYLYVMVCHLYVHVCHLYVTRMYSHTFRMSLICTRMSSVCQQYVLARMSSVCHSYVLVCHPCVTRMLSYVIRMSLVCTRMSSVWHSYVLVCHTYVTRLRFYNEPFGSNIFWMIVVQLKSVYFCLKSCQILPIYLRYYQDSISHWISLWQSVNAKVFAERNKFLPRHKKCWGKLESIFLDFVPHSNVFCRNNELFYVLGAGINNSVKAQL